MQTAREITRTSQNQREIIFDLPHHPTLGTGLYQTIPHPGSQRLEARLVLGVALGDGNRLN